MIRFAAPVLGIGFLAVVSAILSDLRADQQQSHLSVPILFNRNDRSDSPRVRLVLFGKEQEFLFDTGTAPTMFFHSFVTANISNLTDRKQSDGTYQGIPLQGGLSESQVSFALEIPDTPFEDFRGIAGLFSPQSISRGVKVIDMIEGVFHVFPEAETGEVMAEFETRHDERFRPVTWYGTGVGLVPAIFVKGSVGNQRAGFLDLDTGSFRSRYAFTPGDRGISFRDGGLVSDIFGKFFHERETASPMPILVEGHPVGAAHVASTSTDTVVDIPVSGTLGMDILRNCVIVIPEAREKRLYLLCKPQSGGKTTP
jgi:hypothetical protein